MTEDRIARLAQEELAEARQRLKDALRRRVVSHEDLKPILELMRDTYAKVILAGKLAGMVSPWFPVVQEMPPGEASERQDPLPTVRRDLALGDLVSWDFLGKAAEWLGQRVANMPDILAGLVDRSQVEAAAFGQQVDSATMTRLNDALSESIFSGEGRDDWRKRVGDIIDTRAGFDETIQRTAHHQAFRNGQKEILEQPAIADLFPYRQYFSTIDGRERPEHAVMNGKVYHKTSTLAAEADKRLSEWNCRCSEVPLTEEQALVIGVSSGGEPSISAQAKAFVGVPE
jgi:hypothetical protein